MAGVLGFEPRMAVPKTAALPLGYTPAWCWLRDSNPRPTDYKSVALPAELNQHAIIITKKV